MGSFVCEQLKEGVSLLNTIPGREALKAKKILIDTKIFIAPRK